MTNEERGTGFVHLNTPLTIAYTAGQTLSLSELKRKKRRVECVQLPAYMALWRRCGTRYLREEGYSDFQNDMDEERGGGGVVLPPLRKPPTTLTHPHKAVNGSKHGDTNTNFDSVAVMADALRAHFFAPPSPNAKAAAAATATASTASNASHPTSTSAAAPGQATLTTTPATGVAAGLEAAEGVSGGIAIVSHHKVAGEQRFVYPDYDGVLSNGVVPRVVVTADEKAEAEAARKYYISPLQMSADELNAFEELQALWKSRARSHSVQGAQHRAATSGSGGGSLVLPDGTSEQPPSQQHQTRQGRAAGGRDMTSARVKATADDSHVNEEEDEAPKETTDQLLEEALRMADELLRFA